jgi:chitodextrinase
MMRHIRIQLILTALLALASLPSAALAAPSWNTALRRYPYLTDLVGPYATINWATDQSGATGQVRWGQVGVEGCTAHTTPATRTVINVNGTNEYQWKAQLSLTPGTEYCYRVYLGDTPRIDLLDSNPSPRFKTQVPAGSSEPFSFVVFGDWGAVDENGANPDQAALIAQIAASKARFAITTGDNGYPSGSQANYGDLVQTGTNLSGVFGPEFWTVAGASMALFPAIGNHGLSSSSINHPHLLNWPQDRAVAASGGRYAKHTYCCLNNTQSATYASAWYAFDAGNARFYILDSAWSEANIGTASEYENDYDYHWRAGRAERQWLENDLATHRSALKFAFLHYPFYSDNSTEASNTFLQGPGSLEGLLSRSGVNIAFSGHAHTYQRNHRPPGQRLITYVTGGGGAKVAPIGALGCSAIDAYGIGWGFTANRGSACGSAPVPTSAAQVFHFLLVSVSGTRVTVTPTDAQGRTFDVQTYDFGGDADTEFPGAPTGLTATVQANANVSLAWAAASDNVGVIGYTILRDGTVLAKVNGSTLVFTDLSALPGATYTYTVEAFDAAGNESLPSNASTVTIPMPDTEPPSAPANLTLTAMSPTRVDLAWSASTDNVGVVGYTIMRDGTVLATVNDSTFAFTDLSALPGATYTYTVAAFDAAGNHSASASRSVVSKPLTKQFIPVAIGN